MSDVQYEQIEADGWRACTLDPSRELSTLCTMSDRTPSLQQQAEVENPYRADICVHEGRRGSTLEVANAHTLAYTRWSM